MDGGAKVWMCILASTLLFKLTHPLRTYVQFAHEPRPDANGSRRRRSDSPRLARIQFFESLLNLLMYDLGSIGQLLAQRLGGVLALVEIDGVQTKALKFVQLLL